MELSKVRYALAVMAEGSFTAAAEVCGVSQPGLTKSVRRLESELGGPLFHREGNRLLVTELGRTMEPIFQRMSEQVHQAQQAAESFRALRKSSVRLGFMSTIGGRLLASRLAELRRGFPGIDIEIHQASGGDLAARLDHGELDLAVMNASLHERKRHRSELLYQERYVTAFAPGHRFESFNCVGLADLAGESYVDRLSCELRKQFIDLCGAHDLDLLPAIRSDREDWVQELVVSGFGFSILPEFSVSHPRILTRPFVDPEIVREVSLVCVRGRSLSRPARQVREALLKEPDGTRSSASFA